MLSNQSLNYHFHPKTGWLNDPNGLIFFGGKYHLFYQYAPNHEVPQKEPITWGHCVTEDFLHFEEKEPALLPDRSYDCGGVWSGTAAEKDGILYLFYAAVDENGRQTISVATSRDAERFEKYEGNPVISEIPPDGSRDFRDPAILCTKSGNFLAVASGDTRKHTGNVLLYRSEDLLHWDYVGVLREYEHAIYCECPSLVQAGDEMIFSVSVVPPDKAPYFEVMKGSFDGAAFVPRLVSRFQKGPHCYAGQIFSDPKGRSILISWIPGWGFQPEEKCIGCLSLPLELQEKDGKLLAYPIREVQHLLDGNDTLTDAYIRETFIRGGEAVYTTLLETP